MIHTHLFSLIFFGTLSLIGGFVPEQEVHYENGGLRVDFRVRPLDEADCKWFEGRTHGSGPRELRINCRTPQGTNYGCVYKGNPHGCTWYNNGNQLRYYTGLAIEAADKQPTACSLPSLVYYQCPFVTFFKQ